MLIRWTVLVDDGTRPFGAGISPEQRRPLEISLGEDTTIEISLIDPVGGRVLLGGSDFLQLTARTTTSPQRQLLTVRSAVTIPGLYAIQVAAAMTRPLLPVLGEFDLWLIQARSHTALVRPSEFRLLPAALGRNYQ